MLKFDNIIRNLSLEQKIELITNETYGNKTILNYELPTFEIATKLNKTTTNVILPNYNMLGQTWDEKLIQEFASEVAQNSIAYNNRILFGVPIEPKEDNEDRFGTSTYLVGKMAAAFIRGIEDGGAYACANKVYTSDSFDEVEFRSDVIVPAEIAISEGYPRAIVSEGVSNINIINDEIRYKKLKIYEANEAAELIRSINAENHLTLAYGLNVVEIIKNAIHDYKLASIELHKKAITKTTFDSLVRNGEILNEEKIDLALDSLLTHLVDYVEDFQKTGQYISNEILKRVADESIVLIKNDGILPLTANDSITLVGELADKPVLNNYDTNIEVQTKSPLDVFNEEQLNLVNFAYGYHSKLEDSSRLIFEAKDECKKTKVAVVYLGADEESFESTYSLPQNQLDLLKELYNNDINIVAVVSTTKAISMDFTDMCRAVILTGPNTNETIVSTVDVIRGALNPSGRITVDYPRFIDEDGNKSEIKYYIGHGLSYTKFEYRKFNLKHNGVSFICDNNGVYTGNDVMCMFISRLTEDGETKKKLRGFVKYKLSANDYDRFFIPFDDKTFRSYDLKNNCYCVKEGVYKLYLGHTVDDIVYETEVKLSGVLDKSNSYSYEVVESSDCFEDVANRFVDDNESKEAFYKELRGLSFGKKLAASIIIYIYLFLMMILTIVLGFGSKNKLPVIITAAALIFIFTIGFIVYVVKSYKHKKKYEKLTSKSPINDMVNELKVFDISSTEQFEIPTEALVEDELIEEPSVEETEAVIEEVIEADSALVTLEEAEATEVIIEEEKEYIECDFELKADELEYSNDLNFQALCAGFNSYCLKNGLIVEQASIRLIFSSIFSSKLVFIRSTRMDLLPKLTKLLGQYISNEYFSIDADTIQNNSLIWRCEDEQFVQTEFVRYLYQAIQYKKHFNIITLENVDPTMMLDYFNEYYDYCSNPNDEHKVLIGKNEINLPKNLMFIVIPSLYDYLDNLPNEVALYSASIEIQVRENELIPDEDVDIKYYTYQSYADCIRLEKENYYIPEDLWKKLDDFEEALDNEASFRIENKTILQIEDLAAVSMLSGSDVTETLDFVLASKIIPIIKSYGPYKNGASDNIVTKSIERYFEMDTIPNALRALKKAD